MVTPKESMLTEREILQFSVLPYRFSICPSLVTRQMSNLAILADSKTQNVSLFHAMFCHDCPLTVKLASTQWNLVKRTWRGSAFIDMFLSAVSVLVVVQLSSEFPEGLMNNPVLHELIKESLQFLSKYFLFKNKK
jgi:ABC-type polysaccharide transport system permease subunit